MDCCAPSLVAAQGRCLFSFRLLFDFRLPLDFLQRGPSAAPFLLPYTALLLPFQVALSLCSNPSILLDPFFLNTGIPNKHPLISASPPLQTAAPLALTVISQEPKNSNTEHRSGHRQVIGSYKTLRPMLLNCQSVLINTSEGKNPHRPNRVYYWIRYPKFWQSLRRHDCRPDKTWNAQCRIQSKTNKYIRSFLSLYCKNPRPYIRTVVCDWLPLQMVRSGFTLHADSAFPNGPLLHRKTATNRRAITCNQ